MKVFISWSGVRSQAIAEGLRDWLPNVIQILEPWISTSDIEVGKKWSSNIEFQLRETRVGIICLTPENLNAPWILFEAGALSKLDGAIVCPYLLGFEPKDLKGPLVQFQAAAANKQDTLKLVKSLNRALGDSAIKESVVDKAFEIWWPELGKCIELVSSNTDPSFCPIGEPKQFETVHREVGQSDLNKLMDLLRGLAAAPNIEPERTTNDFIFLVHGHDHGAKDAVARLIERLGAKVVILHEQPNEGRTIIEKFELHSNVGYAVILLSADDRGSLASSPDASKPRARQNVILELGYFMGKLGRSRVCVLYEEGVEIPSDYNGVLYIPLDDHNSWHWQLAKELKTAGIRVDLNNIV